MVAVGRDVVGCWPSVVVGPSVVVTVVTAVLVVMVVGPIVLALAVVVVGCWPTVVVGPSVAVTVVVTAVSVVVVAPGQVPHVTGHATSADRPSWPSLWHRTQGFTATHAQSFWGLSGLCHVGSSMHSVVLVLVVG